MHLIPAEGFIPYRTFYSYIAERGFPVTQFIRHGSRPEFTPEPDMIHDCLGHVPPLVNHDYAALLTLLGKAAVSVATGDQVLALKRLSWFSIEFGLIDEGGTTKVFGAGILSSTGEIPFSLSAERRAPSVRHRRGDRDRLRRLTDAGTAVRDPVVPVPEEGSGAVGAAVWRDRLGTLQSATRLRSLRIVRRSATTYSYRNASIGSRREALKAGHIPNEMPIVAEKPMPRANDHQGSEIGKSVSTCTR